MEFILPPEPKKADPNDKFNWMLAKEILNKKFYWACRNMYERYYRGKPMGEEKWLVFFDTYDWNILLKNKKARII